MHPGHVARLQPINRSRQLLAQPFLLDRLQRIRIRMERKDQRLAPGQPMQRLPLTPENRLPQHKH